MEAWGFQIKSVSDSGSDSGSRPRKLGLGIGLGLGLPVLIASLAGFFIVRARSKKQMMDVQELKSVKGAVRIDQNLL